ncbi:MAG: RNA polymerase sigma-70 factor (ECF subfamily) [Polaribacter sp.]|jgi:RNA polymerase sigma-70 factor (ECF subfamily)
MTTTTLNTDEINWKRMSQGDQLAFDDLFRSHYKYLVTVAYGYTKDFAISKDLAQEVFMDIWKRRENIKIQTSLKLFLKRAVINQALTAIKKSQKITNTTEETFQIAANEEDAQGKIELRELKTKLQSLIDSLPKKCKAVFLLSRMENLSHKEIATKLDISTKTIENQITKALKILRMGLQADRLITGSYG